MREVTPFAAGEIAYANGQGPEDNPHFKYSKEWMRWHTGWTAGMLAAEKAARAAQLEEINKRQLPDWAAMEEEK